MRALPWCWAFLLLLPQCGGGGPAGAGRDAESASDAASAENDGAGEPAERASHEGDAEGANAEKSTSATCDDGTCSPCGDGICPSGWYCDEKASACSWLTECADKPTCGCITRVLGSACKCHEEGGGLKVACN